MVKGMGASRGRRIVGGSLRKAQGSMPGCPSGSCRGLFGPVRPVWHSLGVPAASDRLLLRDSAAELDWGPSGDQCQLFYSIQGFDRSLTYECSAFGSLIFGIPYSQRPAVLRVLGASTRSVLFQSPLHIIRDAGVQTIVRALQNVDDPLHSDDSNLFEEAGPSRVLKTSASVILALLEGFTYRTEYASLFSLPCPLLTASRSGGCTAPSSPASVPCRPAGSAARA